MSVTGGSFLSNWWFSIGEYVPLLPGLWRGGRPWECWGSPFVRLHGYFNFASQESVLSISSPPGPLLWFLYWVLSLTAFISLQNKPVICCRIKTARAARLGAYSACVCMLGGRLGGSSSDFICILHFYLFLVQTFNKSFHSGLSYGTLEVHATISGSFDDRWPGPATGVSCPLLLSQYCSVLSSEPDHGSPFLPLRSPLPLPLLFASSHHAFYLFMLVPARSPLLLTSFITTTLVSIRLKRYFIRTFSRQHF